MLRRPPPPAGGSGLLAMTVCAMTVKNNMVKTLKSLSILFWLGIIFISSNIPVSYDDPDRQRVIWEYLYDKSMHLLLFGILSYLIISFLVEYKKLKFYHIAIVAVLFTYFYGITDEWHQGFIAGRGVSYYDLLFDVFGAIFGVIVYKVFQKK